MQSLHAPLQRWFSLPPGRWRSGPADLGRGTDAPDHGTFGNGLREARARRGGPDKSCLNPLSYSLSVTLSLIID